MPIFFCQGSSTNVKPLLITFFASLYGRSPNSLQNYVWIIPFKLYLCKHLFLSLRFRIQNVKRQITNWRLHWKWIFYFFPYPSLVVFCLPFEIELSFSHLTPPDLLIRFQTYMSWWRLIRFMFLRIVLKLNETAFQISQSNLVKLCEKVRFYQHSSVLLPTLGKCWVFKNYSVFLVSFRKSICIMRCNKFSDSKSMCYFTVAEKRILEWRKISKFDPIGKINFFLQITVL